MTNGITLTARGLRLAVIQDQYNQGNLTEAEAKELLAGPLTPGDESTIIDDSDQLQVSFQDAVSSDTKMTDEQKKRWLTPPADAPKVDGPG